MACQLDGTPSACRACLELLETMGIQTTIPDVCKGEINKTLAIRYSSDSLPDSGRKTLVFRYCSS